MSKIHPERLKIINSSVHRKKVKDSIELIKVYQNMDWRSRAKAKNAPMTRKEMSSFSHYFAEELRLEDKRSRERNADKDTRPLTDSVKVW